MPKHVTTPTQPRTQAEATGASAVLFKPEVAAAIARHATMVGARAEPALADDGTEDEGRLLIARFDRDSRRGSYGFPAALGATMKASLLAVKDGSKLTAEEFVGPFADDVLKGRQTAAGAAFRQMVEAGEDPDSGDGSEAFQKYALAIEGRTFFRHEVSAQLSDAAFTLSDRWRKLRNNLMFFWSCLEAAEAWEEDSKRRKALQRRIERRYREARAEALAYLPVAADEVADRDALICICDGGLTQPAADYAAAVLRDAKRLAAGPADHDQDAWAAAITAVYEGRCAKESARRALDRASREFERRCKVPAELVKNRDGDAWTPDELAKSAKSAEEKARLYPKAVAYDQKAEALTASLLDGPEQAEVAARRATERAVLEWSRLTPPTIVSLSQQIEAWMQTFLVFDTTYAADPDVHGKLEQEDPEGAEAMLARVLRHLRALSGGETITPATFDPAPFVRAFEAHEGHELTRSGAQYLGRVYRVGDRPAGEAMWKELAMWKRQMVRDYVRQLEDRSRAVSNILHDVNDLGGKLTLSGDDIIMEGPPHRLLGAATEKVRTDPLLREALRREVIRRARQADDERRYHEENRHPIYSPFLDEVSKNHPAGRQAGHMAIKLGCKPDHLSCVQLKVPGQPEHEPLLHFEDPETGQIRRISPRGDLEVLQVAL